MKNINHKLLIKFLEKNGFKLKRSKGSHHFFYNPNTNHITTVPYHNKNIKIGTLLNIINQAGFSKQNFMKFLNK